MNTKKKFKVIAVCQISPKTFFERLEKLSVTRNDQKFGLLGFKGTIADSQFTLNTFNQPSIAFKGKYETGNNQEETKLDITVRYDDPLEHYHNMVFGITIPLFLIIDGLLFFRYYTTTKHVFWSLLLFLIPFILMEIALHKQKRNPFHQKSLDYLLDFFDGKIV